MPSAQTVRNRAEADLATGLSALLSDQYDALLAQIDPNNPYPPQQSFWDEWRNTILAFLGVGLLSLANEAAEYAMGSYGIGVDWSAVLSASQNWAGSYGFDLVRGINGTTQQALQGLFSQYYSGNIDYDTLTQMLSNQFGPTRAANIAATETTRAFEQGIDIYQQELENLGIMTDRVWVAEPDACPICAPNDGVLESEGWTTDAPPAHPQCRCASEIVVLPGQKAFMEQHVASR